MDLLAPTGQATVQKEKKTLWSGLGIEQHAGGSILPLNPPTHPQVWNSCIKTLRAWLTFNLWLVI